MAGEPHWAEAWVGRAYVAGEHDCADFVVAVLRERFGRTLALPAHAASVRGWDAQIAALKGTFAVPTLQSVGPGWSWTLDSKNDPTRIRIFDGDGNAADAVVDVVVRGIAA